MFKSIIHINLMPYIDYQTKKKSIRITIFLLLLLVCSSLEIFSQNDSVNSLKYWNYRKRLEYFVMPGTAQGQSQVVCIRNRMDYGATDLNYGQHSIYFGYYLGMLATEYKLLQHSTDKNKLLQTKNELKLALMQFNNYMDRCEHLLFKGFKDTIDGFYVRKNVPCNFLEDSLHKNYFNKGLTSENTFNYSFRTFKYLLPGQPGWVNKISECDTIPEVFSQDEAIGLLLGLALVYKYMPDTSMEKKMARTIVGNVINYIRSSSQFYGKAFSLRWNIYRPNGKKVKPHEGGFSFVYAHGFMKAAAFFDLDNDGVWKKITRYPQELLFQYGQFFPGFTTDNSSMIASLAAIGDSWRATVPVIGLIFKMNTTRFGLKKKTSYQDWETFYLLLWNDLHDKNYSDTKLYSKAAEQLNKAPFNGPYNYGKGNNPKGSGWSSSYRFHLKKKVQDGIDDGILGNYNGLDYMLLHNLYCIAKGISFE